MSSNDNQLTNIDRIVLTEYPYPIAVGYRRVLEAPDPRAKVERCLQVFDLGMRLLALGFVQQYSLRDAQTLNSEELNGLILKGLPRPTLGVWKNIIFAALRAYRTHPDLLFMKELHKLYWDASDKTREIIEHPYEKLVEMRNDIIHIKMIQLKEPDWPGFSKEAVPYLIEILMQFEFLRRYDLIHIVSHEGNQYRYVQYTGETPVLSASPIVTDSDLKIGWLYLTRDKTEFVQLHPLLIFHDAEDDGSLLNEFGVGKMLINIPGDTALYNAFRKNKVTYIAAVMGEEVIENDPQIVGEFILRLHDNIIQLMKLQQVAKRITWALLRDVAKKVSIERFGEVRSKYNSELYLQRQDVKEQFETFLRNDKSSAFLLLGKSGVGKSSFFLSLADEYEARNEICVFLYNGARLITTQTMEEIIGEDIRSYLSLEDIETISDPLVTISTIRGVEQQRVVFFIDAINENADAKQLLRLVDSFVSKAARYPWAKIVVSCRPEAWKAIKRGVALAEHRYYTRSGSQDMGVELPAFSLVQSRNSSTVDAPSQTQGDLGISMGDFSIKAELPEVYEKYKEMYGLQTEYGDISMDLRKILTDPLTLKLIAYIYRGSRLPRSFQPGEIYPKYIAQMIETGRLESGDSKFMENELMPLMLAEDHYDNKITDEQVDQAVTNSGIQLADLISNEDRLSSGRPMNQSFQNLANAEILVMRGSAYDYEIGFKYERFYDYFGGKRLYKIASSKSDRYEFYLEMIKRTSK